MKKCLALLPLATHFFLIACSPVTTVSTQYKLSAYSAKQLSSRFSRNSILITQPEAVTGYQTEQMMYVKKLFELNAFANNAWVGPPADMLFPLIAQSLQRSGYFYAVTSSPHPEPTTYRLDTQLIELQQNFLKKPSEVNLTAKIVLTHVADSRVIASRLITERVSCPFDSPYGGVIAANLASERFTREVTAFVMGAIRKKQSEKWKENQIERP